MKTTIFIGIDTGTNTGIAIWSIVQKTFISIDTVKIHKAMDFVRRYKDIADPYKIKVRVEDARKRTWFGKESGREKLQGAGSIKRDAVIWEDFLTDLGIDFEMVAPKNNKTKLSADAFKRMSKWEGKTNEHSRDAAMLVINF